MHFRCQPNWDANFVDDWEVLLAVYANFVVITKSLDMIEKLVGLRNTVGRCCGGRGAMRVGHDVLTICCVRNFISFDIFGCLANENTSEIKNAINKVISLTP